MRYRLVDCALLDDGKGGLGSAFLPRVDGKQLVDAASVVSREQSMGSHCRKAVDRFQASPSVRRRRA